MNAIYSDDLKIGQRFLSGTYEISEQSIIDFAREYDVQAFHLDAVAANDSLFRGLSASGWHTAAIAMRLFTTTVRFAGGAIGLGIDELRWPVAVRPDDRLQLETEILEMRVSRSKPGQGIIRIRNVLRNQNGEVVLSYRADVMSQRKPDA